jgi:DNA-binding NtrC family response regulator
MDHMVSRLSLNVLIADDSRAVHSIFAEIAAASPVPIKLMRAENGRECMKILNEGRTNVAFIDVNMPEMSGMDAVGEARRTGDKTFVALMSGNSNKVRLQLARQLKVYEFLAKPFSAADVLAILQTYCRVTAPSEALIVDDSATVRRIIRRVFDDSIFNIDSTEAADGETALAYTENNSYDAVFLDCNMPGLNGLETLDRLIKRDPGVKVIMISGEQNEQRRLLALDRGATAFLYKPFTGTDIDRELHAVFGLRVPQLAGIEPMKFARALPAPAMPVEVSWR